MRRKRHKATRRALRFFRIAAGFREPYKVLLDGNFVHALRGTAPEEALTRLLGARCRALTTRCVLAELATLPECAEALHAAKRGAALHKCGHEGEPLPAAACLKACVGDGNGDHFVVATQDRSLRTALGRTPAGATIFVSAAGPAVEPPTDAQRAAARGAGAAAGDHVADRDLILDAAAEARAEAKAAGASGGSVAWRRNRARGPNPLSARKPSKPKKQGTGAVSPKRPAAEGDAPAARKRKRKPRGCVGGEAA